MKPTIRYQSQLLFRRTYKPGPYLNLVMSAAVRRNRLRLLFTSRAPALDPPPKRETTS
jgi:hypothetical protein